MKHLEVVIKLMLYICKKFNENADDGLKDMEGMISIKKIPNSMEYCAIKIFDGVIAENHKPHL
ncbi:MAG: hypothetical protein AB2693_27350 [Candidatus Thiodiazotropha sp.]